MADFASQSGHFYSKAGEPRYEVPNVSKGGMRPTTARDAAKHGWVPSITTLMKLLHKEGLVTWLIDQGILAALTLPRRDGEPEGEWLKRVKEDAKETGRKAAERGTNCHTALELMSQGVPIAQWPDAAKPFFEHAIGAIQCVEEKTGIPIHKWSAEKSAAHPLGYGCKTDLIHEEWVIDYKTKEFGPDSKLGVYEEHAIQLAGNKHAHGFPQARGAIVYVSVTHPGLCQFVEVPQKDMEKGFAMLTALIDLWIAKTGYNPRAT